MKISISFDFFGSSELQKTVDFSDYCVIVIDVLRASATICTLLDLCDKIYITGSIEKAANIENSIKIGERNAKKIEGFDFGNSPVELTVNRKLIKEHFENGGNIVLTTTNGTRVLENIVSDHILIGSITNAQNVAKKAYKLAKENNKGIMLVPVHRKGNFAIEDFIGAGIIADYIFKEYDEEIPDEKFEELIPARALTKSDWLRKIFESNSGKNLKELGYFEDLIFCTSKNTQKSVGIFDKKSGSISSF
ncbi:2-phosphosulfolactate phosphatase [Methanococcus maripaludis]|uniref:2-phosphosulfolactate phosphatase n=1 Tax=Methanococcus maripaludis TaxID=39152 RepID=A0A2L1CAD2_METMI|nr:2-phosphosulfolactate phosphatase [Methanococcus maripaludis]AVB76332.1 putative 2-phosphosulfolactate phosphatase [Methanococcus maripaludis]MBA2853320.1 2-phosphosulfolactate phosphatase [Methanococcus maripaludis]MBA2864859.1 2-phosphosulfolactate phosphatase [Methanococcus maripaludis]MBB6497602.1 2-phosphosulfolactate phosphatase [Methanococcus maripaludis]